MNDAYATSTSNDPDDNDDRDVAVVEIANLLLPSHATGIGLEAGEGDQVVLEAAPDTVEALASDLAR